MVGIYRIKNLVNGKCYYGSSKNIEKRWKRHKRELKKNTHINCILQRSWDKYGEDNFLFEVVEECSVDIILETEQKYLDLQPEYNIGIKSSGGDNLTRNPNKDIIISKIKKSLIERMSSLSIEERKEKFSKPMESNPNWKGGKSFIYCVCGKRIGYGNNYCIKCIPRSDENNPFYGKKHSDETKDIIRKKRKGKKPTNMRQILIDDKLYESLTEASRVTGIPTPTILWRLKSKNKKYENYKLPLSN
jgi:group I intron endonuclease